MSIRPNIDDIGIIEHPAFRYHYLIVKVIKVTAARVVFAPLQPDGSWGEERSRKIDRFMFIPKETSLETLLEMREELKKIAEQQMRDIATIEKTAKAKVLMMAASGKAPADG